MEVTIVGITAFLAAGATFFSGFGLGTLLMPVLALFFPIETAISMTATVHLLNNGLKLFLVGRHVDLYVGLIFGIPAALAAFFGAWLLAYLANFPSLVTYHLFGYDFYIMPIKVVVGSLLMVFTLLEMAGKDRGFVASEECLFLGGVLSGFFGGLSGHQGALRSAFLIRAELPKESFIGTGVAIACLVDVSRLAVYGASFSATTSNTQFFTLLVSVVSAFAGTLVGNYMLNKVTIQAIQLTVSVMVFASR